MWERKALKPRKENMPKNKKEEVKEETVIKDTLVAKETKQEETEAEKPKIAKVSAPKTEVKPEKSKKLIEAQKLVDPNRKYSLVEAIGLVKKTSYSKFDGTVELHIRTSLNKGQELLRGLIEMPSGSAKLPKVVVADEGIIAEIKANKINFDILIATPALMPKLATVARILGPKGLMPSPKSGTVVEDTDKALEEFKKGKVEYKSDPLGNIHIPIGKVSWSVEKLEANVRAALNPIAQNRLMAQSLSATMGPGIKFK